MWTAYVQVAINESQQIVRILDALLRCSSDEQWRAELRFRKISPAAQWA